MAAVALLPRLLVAETVHVAVASNFMPTARTLAPAFEETTGHQLRLSAGSTGKLYAQITAGAPYDVLLAADADRPALLARDGHGVAKSRFTYAVGRLVLWSTAPEYRDRDCVQALRKKAFRRLAIANPAVAPYGVAAREVLRHLSVWPAARAQTVLGENVTQALQFVASGNASLGLVADASLRLATLPPGTCHYAIPARWHAPIEQQAIVLARAAGAPEVLAFMHFLKGEGARRVIEAAGYSVPPKGLP